MSAPVRPTALLAALVTGLSTLLLVAAPPSSAAPPTNDHLANATAVSLAAGAGTTLDLTTAEATREGGEPTPCGSIKNTVWVAYTAVDDQVLTAQTGTNTQMDTVLAAHTATTPGAYPLVSPAVACNDDASGIGRNSRITFRANAGTTYYLQVGHYGGSPLPGAPDPGPLSLSLSAAVAVPNDDVGSPTSIGLGSGSIAADTTNATHAGTDPEKPVSTGRTLWYRWQAPSTGHVRFSAGTGDPTNPDTFLFAFPDDGGATTQATALAYNDDVDEDNEDYRAAITFPVVAMTTYRILAGTRLNHGGFSLSWEPATVEPPPGNDDFGNATVLSSTVSGGPSAGNTQDATAQPQDPDFAGTSGGHSVWYRWTAPQDGVYDFSTAAVTSGVDTFLGVLTGSTLGTLEQVTGNDDAGDGVHASLARFAAVANTTYTIMVDGWPHRTRGDFTLTWTKVVPKVTTTVITAGSPEPGLVDIDVSVHRNADMLPASGDVVISDGGTVLGSVPLVGGSVSKRFRNQAGGSHTYTADFTPDDPLSEAPSTDSAPPVTVVARPRPANDDFAKAIVISGTSGTSPYVDLLGASRQKGEPTLVPGVDGASVWYRWTAPASDGYTFSLQDDGTGTADPVVGIVRGNQLSDLTVVRASSDPAGSFAQVTFSAIEGRVYYVMVDAIVPGSVALSWSRTGGSSTATNLIGADSLGPYELQAEAEVTPVVPGSFVLLRDGAVVAESPETDGTVMFDLDFQRPGPSTVVVEFYPDDLTVRPSSSQSDQVTVVAPPPPPNDLFANAENLEEATQGVPQPGSTYGATADPKTPATALPSYADTSVWYRWVAPANGQYLFTVTRDDVPTDTVMRAFEGTSITGLRLLDENDDADPFTGTSQVGINAVAGRTYHLLVDAYSLSTIGTFTLEWGGFEGATPTATTLTATAGQRVATLTVTVDDLGATANPAGYVEFFDGTRKLFVTAPMTAASNRATRRLTFVNAGVHHYRAVFVPDDVQLAQSTSPTRTVTVSKILTTTTLAAPTRVRPGARPTVTAQVNASPGNTRFVQGGVRFTLDGRVLRTVPLSGGLRASLTLPALAAGTARVVATYLGYRNVAASSLASRSITVRR